MIKKDQYYYPTDGSKKNAWLTDKSVYQEAANEPIKFWERLAGDLVWKKKWEKSFEHSAPYFKWFVGGKMNITDSIFSNNESKTALIWQPEPENDEPRIYTYGGLLDEVNKLANYLKKLGVKKGDRVGVYLPVIPEVVTSMLACAKIGAIHSVVFSAFSSQALKARLQDTKAEVLITADSYWRRGQLIDLLKNANEGVIDTDIKEIVIVKRDGSESPWQNESSACESEEMDAEDALFILYTSGSTGKPKGVVHTCGGYSVQAKASGKYIFDFHSEDIFWCTSDPGWITGHTYTIYSPLLNGIATLMFEGAPDWPTPGRWADIIDQYKVNIFYTAPTAIRMFERYGAETIKNNTFSSLRLLGSVGEPIDEAAWQWYFKEVGKERCPIVDTWWQTETGSIVISSLPGIGPFRPAFAGLPFPGIKVDILDESGNSCPSEVEGNLVILPPFAPGLLRDVYMNSQKYIENYWSRYGDSVYFSSDGAMRDGNGMVRVIGRIDDVIKVAGHRVTTGELEAAVNSHSGITECAVVGVADSIKGEVPIVFAVSSESSESIKQGIIDKIKSVIGPIALPKAVYLVSDLPKTRSGKIMRRILRKMFTGEDLGDLSTLSNPESVEKIKDVINL